MLRTVVVLAFALVGGGPALAAPCAGFTDVDSANAFCPSVEWLKNRAVTTGCTATLYCPADLVSRLSMAAFMQRLGKTLTPDLQSAVQSGATLDLDAGTLICQTSVVAGTSYPRSASVRGSLSAQLGSAAGIAIQVVEAVNGGAWTVRNVHAASVQGANRWVNVSVGKGALPVAVNDGTQYALRVSRYGTGTADAGNWSCQLEAVYDSRTGTSSPF